MNILGVKVDQVSLDEAASKIENWLVSSEKHFVTTPNLEFIQVAQKDGEFKDILNKADLAIPDSSRLSWLYKLTEEKNWAKRLAIFPAGILPKVFGLTQFDVVPGVDLMERLCKESGEKGFTIGLLGGAPGVAEKTKECLQKKYPNIKISYSIVGTVFPANLEMVNKYYSWIPDPVRDDKVDILFVAFGHGKQEKWIAENLNKIPVKVAMGVGGAFDYISGNVLRAPSWIRALGMEWFFRLIIQPWRIKRQISLAWFLISQI